MSEEEKKALADCDIIFLILEDMMSEKRANKHRASYRVIKKLIEKQQKEIEELRKPKDNIQVVYGGRSYGKTLKTKDFITKDYISKDKIREKIDEINNEKLGYSEDEYYLEDEIKSYSIDKIKELLEEE